MTRCPGETARQTIEAVLVMLLDRLASPGTPMRVALFVGRDHGAVLVAEAARDPWRPTPGEELASTDWPLEVSREPIGFLRFEIPDAAHERASTATLAAITAQLAREEPRVSDFVIGLTYMATLADCFRNADAARSRHGAA